MSKDRQKTYKNRGRNISVGGGASEEVSFYSSVCLCFTGP